MNNSLREIADAIKNNSTFALVPHINPDPDAIGSCYALKHVIEFMGKSADVFIQDTLPSYLSFLPDKTKMYEKAEKYDVCICVDCGDTGRIDKCIELLQKASLSINIDHHYSNPAYAQLNHIDSSSSSTGEICYGLIKELGVEIDLFAATCIYSAICGDTGNFMYSNTSAKTLRIAAELLECGVCAPKICKAIYDTESFDAIRIKGEISCSAQTYANGLIGVVELRKETLSKYCVDSRDVDNIVNIARKIEGVEVAISFKETDEAVKVSIRSNEYVDVSKIAAKFGGGGHVRASGLVIKNTNFDGAKKMVIEEAEKAVKEYMQ